MVIRKEFQEILLKWQGKKIIKVVTGVRRCGKSTLLLEFQKTLLSQKVVQFLDLHDQSLISLVKVSNNWGALQFNYF